MERAGPNMVEGPAIGQTGCEERKQPWHSSLINNYATSSPGNQSVVGDRLTPRVIPPLRLNPRFPTSLIVHKRIAYNTLVIHTNCIVRFDNPDKFT